MRSNRRIIRATLVVPVIFAMTNPVRAADDPLGTTSQSPSSPQTSPPIPVKASVQGPTKGTNQSGIIPYGSDGPPTLARIPTPQSAGQDTSTLPAIDQVASPYRSDGPPGLSALSTPQISGTLGTGGAFLGAGGTMNAPTPSESTAAPGTSSPFAIPPAGADASQGRSPSEMFGAGNAGAGTDIFGGSGGAPSSGLGGFGSGAQSAFAMIGDASPPIGRGLAASATQSNPPPPPPPGDKSKLIIPGR